MDDLKDPVSPQPVKDGGAIHDATVPAPEFEDGAVAVIFDRATGTVRYEPRP